MEYRRIRIDKIDLLLPVVIRNERGVGAIQLQNNLQVKDYGLPTIQRARGG